MATMSPERQLSSAFAALKVQMQQIETKLDHGQTAKALLGLLTLENSIATLRESLDLKRSADDRRLLELIANATERN